jgi:hypothetical protein
MAGCAVRTAVAAVTVQLCSHAAPVTGAVRPVGHTAHSLPEQQHMTQDSPVSLAPIILSTCPQASGSHASKPRASNRVHCLLLPVLQLSYQPGPGELVHTDREVFALAWLSLWTPLTCLDNFSADIRGRLLLDLLNEPSRLSGGLGWR